MTLYPLYRQDMACSRVYGVLPPESSCIIVNILYKRDN
jgi:hypothetical protein